MNLLLYLLFNLNLLKLSLVNVQKWAKQRNVSKLIFALKRGTYKVRKAAALQLGNLKNNEAIPALIYATKDKAKPVAQASIKALKHFSVNKKVKQGLEEAKKFWILQDKKIENKNAYYINTTKIHQQPKPLFDKSRMKNLARLKKQLKKSSSFMMHG